MTVGSGSTLFWQIDPFMIFQHVVLAGDWNTIFDPAIDHPALGY